MESNVKRNLLYNSIYQVLTVILPVITIPYISRVLGPEKLGEYSYSYAIAYYFVLFAVLGLQNYGNRTIARIRQDSKTLSYTFSGIYYMQLITSSCLTLLYVLFAVFLSNNVMTWICLLYVLSAVFDINWFFYGLEQFKIPVIRNTLVKLLATLSIFVVVKSQNDIFLYALIMTGSIFLSQLLLWPFLGKNANFVKVKKTDILQHVKPNCILFIPILAVSLYKVMDKIMLGLMTTKTEVGLYTSAEQVIQIPMALITGMGMVMLPKMSYLFANNSIAESKSYFKKSIMLAMFCASSMCFGLMGIARYFVPVFYGDEYSKCIILFQILLPSCVFLAFANVIRTQFLIPKQMDGIFIKSVSLGAVINLICNWLLIPLYQSIGAAIGTLVAEIVVCVYQIIKIKNQIEIMQYLKESFLFVVPAIIMYCILMLINFNLNNLLSMLLLVVIGAAVYFTLLDIFGIICYRRNLLIEIKSRIIRK